MRQQLSLDTMDNFDYGRGKILFDGLLAEAVRDLVDRPGVKAERTVDLRIHLKPVVMQDGDVVDAEVSISGKTTLPRRQTGATHTAITSQGRLVFQDMADDPRQTTVDELPTERDAAD